jgi:predicted RNase H-like HicB family nuclease
MAMSEKATYIALIHKEEGTAYGVSFPDFPGCITAGDTMDEALMRAHEVLPFHIEGMLEDNDDIPLPSTLEAVMADPDNLGGLAVLISIEMPTGKAQRVNVTFEERLLKQIDAFAESHRMTRSAFLAEASRRMLRSAP